MCNVIKMFVDGFKRDENTSQFNKNFMENYNEDIDKGYFLKLMFNILKNNMIFTIIYYLNQKELKLKKLKNLQPTCMINKNM